MDKRRVVVVLMLAFKSINCLISKFFLISKLSLQEYCVNWSWKIHILSDYQRIYLEQKKKTLYKSTAVQITETFNSVLGFTGSCVYTIPKTEGTVRWRGKMSTKARWSECHLMMVSSIYEREVHPWNLDIMSA